MTSVVMKLERNTILPHLLDPDGQVPTQLSSRGRNLINLIGEIVEAVSSTRELQCSEQISCPKYIAKMRCKGYICAWVSEQEELSLINWFCLDCGYGGKIYEWQGSVFDRYEIRQKRIHEYISSGVWLNDLRLDEIKLLSIQKTAYNGFTYLSYPPSRIIVKNAQDGVIELRLPALLAVEIFHKGVFSSANKTVSLRLGHANAIDYCLSQIRYAYGDDGTVEFELLPEKTALK